MELTFGSPALLKTNSKIPFGFVVSSELVKILIMGTINPIPTSSKMAANTMSINWNSEEKRAFVGIRLNRFRAAWNETKGGFIFTKFSDLLLVGFERSTSGEDWCFEETKNIELWPGIQHGHVISMNWVLVCLRQ